MRRRPNLRAARVTGIDTLEIIPLAATHAVMDKRGVRCSPRRAVTSWKTREGGRVDEQLAHWIDANIQAFERPRAQ